MPKNKKKKSSTSTMTRVIIGLLALGMVIPALASILQLF